MKRLSVLQKYALMLQFKTEKMQRPLSRRLKLSSSSIEHTLICVHGQSMSDSTFMNLSDTLSNYGNDSIR